MFVSRDKNSPNRAFYTSDQLSFLPVTPFTSRYLYCSKLLTICQDAVFRLKSRTEPESPVYYNRYTSEKGLLLFSGVRHITRSII
jgi:hypothetical protein